MRLQFLKIYIRNQKWQKVITVINVLGLVIGLLSSLFILEYVFFERSFDSYHKHAKQVYRVVYDRYQYDKLQWKTANSLYPIGKWMKENCSEVEDYAVVSRKYNITVDYENSAGRLAYYFEPKAYYSSRSLFNLFDIPILQGNINGLSQPNTVALSKKIVSKYFGSEDPIGKTITVNKVEKYTVIAVFKDIPANSHLKTGFLFSIETLISKRPATLSDWYWDYFHTYLLLRKGVNVKEFERTAFNRMIKQNYQSILSLSEARDEYFLQALPDIHLHSNIEYETEPPGSSKTINILMGFGLFLLAVAWINYINLVTAQALERAKEVGIKKINGAGKFQLVVQFIMEAFLFNLFCLAITLLLFHLLNPSFKALTGIEDYSLFSQPQLIVLGLAVFGSGILLSAIYPALILSSYRPAAILKGKFINSGQGIIFRKTLVTIQFVISIVLLTGTLVSYKQAMFLLSKDMGIDFSKTIVVRAPIVAENNENHKEKLKLFRNQVIQLPEVDDFTFSSDIPGQEINHWFVGYRKGYDTNDIKAYFQIAFDDRFLDFYKVKLLAGRKFRKDEQPELRNVIMNLQAIQRFGYTKPEEAIDKIIIDLGGNENRVVGVVEDFQYKSVKTEPVPTVLTLNNDDITFLNIRSDNGAKVGYHSLIAKLQDLYKQNFPDQPFECFSLDDKMLQDLKPDKTFASIFGLFSILAILVAVIGMIGLILITITQKMKEFGVRKTLGAPLNDIYRVLTKQLLLQFMLAVFVAVPLSYYGFENWFLSSYVHHIKLNMWVFALPVLLIGVVVFIVVLLLSAHAYRLRIAQVLQYE